MIHPVFEPFDQLHRVRESLRQGWQIAPPVLGCDAYIGIGGSVRAVQIILTNQRQAQHIALHDDPIVRQFLHEYGLQVIDL